MEENCDHHESEQSEHKYLGCLRCGESEFPLKRCSTCKLAWYCSEEHQLEDWASGHKEECEMSAVFSEGEDLLDFAVLLNSKRYHELLLKSKEYWNQAISTDILEKRLQNIRKALRICLEIFHNMTVADAQRGWDDSHNEGIQDVELLYFMCLELYSVTFIEKNLSSNPEMCKVIVKRMLKRAFHFRTMQDSCAYLEFANAETHMGHIYLGVGNEKLAYKKYEKALHLYDLAKKVISKGYQDRIAKKWVKYSVGNELSVRKKLTHLALVKGCDEIAESFYLKAKELCEHPLQLLALRYERAEMSRLIVEDIRARLKRYVFQKRIRPDKVKEYKELAADLNKHMIYCTTEFPTLAADSLEHDSFYSWSRTVTSASSFYVSNFESSPDIVQMGFGLADTVLNVHSCGNTCYDTVCAMQILASNRMDQVQQESSESASASPPMLCSRSPNASLWQLEKRKANIQVNIQSTETKIKAEPEGEPDTLNGNKTEAEEAIKSLNASRCIKSGDKDISKIYSRRSKTDPRDSEELKSDWIWT